MFEKSILFFFINMIGHALYIDNIRVFSKIRPFDIFANKQTPSFFYGLWFIV